MPHCHGSEVITKSVARLDSLERALCGQLTDPPVQPWLLKNREERAVACASSLHRLNARQKPRTASTATCRRGV
jgi:hypothetical protein